MAEDRLTADGERIFRELDKLNELMVAIGFQHGKATEENGVDVCDVAAFNELGTEHIPSRPFMRQSVDGNEDKITEFLQSKVNEIIGGKTAEQVLKEIGAFQKGLIQETIKEGVFIPNAPETIQRKSKKGGPVTPLIDTGQMRQSVNYQIKKKGG